MVGRQRGGHGAAEAEHLGGAHAEAVVGGTSGHGEAGLGHVEPVHAGGLATPAGEVAGLAQVVALGGEEVGVEREDDVGADQAVLGVEGAAEGQRRALARGVVGHRAPAVDAGPGEAGQQPGAQVGLGRRAGGLGQHPQPGAAVLGEHAGQRRELAEVGAPGQRLAVADHAGQPMRVVEIEDGGQLVEAGAAEAGRVIRVALHLGGAALVALDHHAHAVAAAGDGRGVVGGDARGHAGRALDVGDHLLARRLAGREAGQRRRGAQDLQEGAAGEALGRRLLAVGVGAGLRIDGAVPLGEAAPARGRRPAGGGLSEDGEA